MGSLPDIRQSEEGQDVVEEEGEEEDTVSSASYEIDVSATAKDMRESVRKSVKLLGNVFATVAAAEKKKTASSGDNIPSLPEFRMGEKINHHQDKVMYINLKGETTLGCLFLTNYQLIFVPTPTALTVSPSTPTSYYYFFISFSSSISLPLVLFKESKKEDDTWKLPVGHIDRIVPVGEITVQFGPCYGLKLVCRHACELDFVLLDADEGPNFLKKLEESAFPSKVYILTFSSCHGSSQSLVRNSFSLFLLPILFKGVEGMFAFAFRRAVGNPGKGWKVLDAQSEYARLGLTSGEYRVSTINEKYEMCETYPRFVSTLMLIKDSDLQEIAGYRR
jgi:hypothetical protein